jgi:hypothetical protein
MRTSSRRCNDVTSMQDPFTEGKSALLCSSRSRGANWMVPRTVFRVPPSSSDSESDSEKSSQSSSPFPNPSTSHLRPGDNAS